MHAKQPFEERKTPRRGANMIPNRRNTVNKLRRKEFFQTLMFFIVTVCSIGGLILYLWIYTEIDETLMAIEMQKSTMSELDNSIIELKSEIARLYRVDRITAFAREKLGMVVAEPESIFVLVDPVVLEVEVD